MQISGPIDADQLQLENANIINVLRVKNKELVNARSAIGSARVKKNCFKTKLRREQEREQELQKVLEYELNKNIVKSSFYIIFLYDLISDNTPKKYQNVRKL